MSNNKPWDKNWCISMPESFGIEKLIEIRQSITAPDLLWEWCKEGKKKYPLFAMQPHQPAYHPLAEFINSKIDPAWVRIERTFRNILYIDLPISEKWLADFLDQCKTFDSMYFQTVFKVLYGCDNKKGLRLCDVFLDLLEDGRKTPATFPASAIDCSMGELESFQKAINALDLDGDKYGYSVKVSSDKIEIQVIR